MTPMSLTEAHSFRCNVASGEFCAIIHTCGQMTFWKAQPTQQLADALHRHPQAV